MKCPCDDCLVTLPCREMCENAKPYFESLTTKVDDFDWTAYYERRKRILKRIVEKHTGEDVETARKLVSMEYLSVADIEKTPVKKKRKKEIKDAERGRTGTGTKILRKVKHFCSKYFKNQGVA